MHAIVRGALHFRLLVLGIAVGVLAVGFVQLRSAPVDVLPEFTPPYAEIQTEALGLSADEVEQLITVPLEADLLNGVEGVDVIRSRSLPGMSSIVMVFSPGTDVYRARQLVEERLTQAHALPNVSKPPTLLQPLSSTNRVLMIGLSSAQLTPIEQSVIARWTVRPRLMGVPGVANVAVWGMRDQQIQVQVDPAVLRDNGVTLNQVIRSAGNAQVVSPLSFLEASTPGTGGFVETPQQRLQVRHLLEKIADPAELGKVPVSGTGGKLRLTDVADIAVDHQPLIGDAVIDGGQGLLLVVEKFPGADTLAVTEGVEDALDALRPGLTGLRTDASLFRPATYLEQASRNVLVVLGLGFVLMVLGIGLLRSSWRAAAVAAVTVPLSAVSAALLLDLLGQGFNALVLVGLAAALAIVVDEAIVLTDRAVHRLRSSREENGHGSVTAVVMAAAADVRGALTYAAIIALLAIVPVAVLAGRPGAFLASMVLGYVLALVAGVVVAVTVTPVLAALLYGSGRRPAGPPQRARRFAAAYGRTLARFSRTGRTPLVAAGVCALVGLLTLPLLGVSLVPTFRDTAVLVKLDGQPGTSSPRMTGIATDLSNRLSAVPGVRAVSAQVGRAVTGDTVTDVSSAEVWVAIDPGADHGATMTSIENVVGEVRGVRHEVLPYTTEAMRTVGALAAGQNRVRGNDLDLLTGSEQPLVVRLFGQDLDVLREQAERVRRVMASVSGVDKPRVDLPAEQPTIEIEVDLDKAQGLGVTPGDVRRSAATLLQGIQVGSVFQQQKVFDVIVQGAPSTRGDVATVRDLIIDRPTGGHVRLGDVADVRVVPAPAVIQRDAVSRRLDVVAGVSGRGVDAVADDVRTKLAALTFPIEYHAEVLRGDTADEIGLGRVIGFAGAAAVAAFLLLQAAFRSWRLAGVVTALLPLTLVGGLLAALVTGAELSLGSLLGLLLLLSLATRTVIVLVRSAQAQLARGSTVQAAAELRLAPVVTTVAALGLLLAPAALRGPVAGLELLQPMAVVVLGGLVTVALVTLFLVPATCVHLPDGAVGEPPTTIDLKPFEAAREPVPPQRAVPAGTDGELVR